MTLVCEDANSNLVEVVTFVDVDARDRVTNSLSQIWLIFCSDFEHQVWFKILKLKFRKDFEADDPNTQQDLLHKTAGRWR